MQKIKVLIIDDHPLIREGLRAVLGFTNDHYNFIVEEAQNGEEALVKVKKYNYDIILVDNQMPKLNGVETTKAILRHKPNIPILALSNYNCIRYVEDFLKAGAKGYLLKDTDLNELINAITTVLNGNSYLSQEIALKLINAKNQTKKGKRKRPVKI